MAENDNKRIDFGRIEDDKLYFEVKRALLDKTPAPNVNKAFHLFLKRNRLEPRRRSALWISLATSAVAACIAGLVVLALWKWGGEDGLYPQIPVTELAKMGNVVYHAPAERQFISLSVGDRIVDINDETTAKDAGVAMMQDNIIRIFDAPAVTSDDVTITVPAGQTALLMLDDGTQVNLSAGSRLTIPHHFREAETREVKLCGEAYFEVSHDESHPFIVNTGGMTTKVLGTKFDVRCFPGETCEVTLEEGSVLVSGNGQETMLSPKETARLNADGTLLTHPADMEQALGWLHGDFYFDGQTLQEIMTEIGRWYNFNVVFADDRNLQEQLHFSASRTAQVSEIVRQLQLIGNARIELKNKERILLVR